MNHKGLKPRIQVTIEAELGAVDFSKNDPLFKAIVGSASRLGIDLTADK